MSWKVHIHKHVQRDGLGWWYVWVRDILNNSWSYQYCEQFPTLAQAMIRAAVVYKKLQYWKDQKA